MAFIQRSRRAQDEKGQFISSLFCQALSDSRVPDHPAGSMGMIPVLEARLGFSLDGLLGCSEPVRFLQERDFSDEDLELLASFLLKSLPSSSSLMSFVSAVRTYLDASGRCSFFLHSFFQQSEQ